MTNVIPMLGAGGKGQLVNEQAEASLLGLLLTKPEFVGKLPDTFDPSHYGMQDHADIHHAIVEVGKPGIPAAIAVIQAVALNDQALKTYIAGLLAAPTSYMPGMVPQLAEIVTDLHRRRQLVAVSEAMREGAFDIRPADATLAQAMVDLEQVTHTGPRHSSMSLGDAIDLALNRADDAAGRDGPAGISTGFPAIDEKLGGLEPGSLTVLAGRPGMGKTALGHQIALNAARQGVSVLEISLEMSAAELGRRALAAAARVPVWAMKKGLHRPYVEKLLEARAELRDLPLTIEDGGGLTASTIGMRARAAQRRHKGLGLIMVDHLHIVRPEDGDARQGPTWAIGRISGAMKRLAKEFGCPVLLLAQLNRGVEGRDDKRPTLSDLRQSGDIEQDADAVGFVYRAEYYLQRDPERLESETAEQFANRATRHEEAKRNARGKADLIFAKVRDGEAGTIPLLFDGETTSFAEAGL